MKRGKFKTKEEFSAGGVVYKRVGSSYKILVGKHSGYHKWVLPKGMVEKGESPEMAALREVEEELGVIARIVDMAPIGNTEYYYFADLEDTVGVDGKGEESTRRVKKYQEEGGNKIRVRKQVVWYLMEMGEDNERGWEMEDKDWLLIDKAIEILAFDDEKKVVEKVKRELT